MAIDMTTTRTRRGILAGAVGGVAAWVGTAVGRAMPARATDGEPLVVGTDNTATKMTRIINSGTDAQGDALVAWDAAEMVGGGLSAGGNGVSGENGNDGGCGVWGRSQGNGVGVLGWSQLLGTEFGIQLPARTGVYGRAIQDTTSVGVLGESAAGDGVRGTATSGAGVHAVASSGTGVYASSASGYALRTSGRLRLEKASGSATILSGRSSVTVTPGVDVVGSSLVLVTPRSDPGSRRLWATRDTTANTITIRVSSAVSSSLAVNWLVLG